MIVLSMKTMGEMRLIETWPDQRLISFRTRALLIGKVSTFTLLYSGARTSAILQHLRDTTVLTRFFPRDFFIVHSRTSVMTSTFFSTVCGQRSNRKRVFYKHLERHAWIFKHSRKPADFHVNWVANIFRREVKKKSNAQWQCMH